jgi:hypothetical protein
VDALDVRQTSALSERKRATPPRHFSSAQPAVHLLLPTRRHLHPIIIIIAGEFGSVVLSRLATVEKGSADSTLAAYKWEMK